MYERNICPIFAELKIIKMKRKKKKTISESEIECFTPFSFESLLRPTVKMAAEVMNVRSSVIYEWLEQAQISINDDKLSSCAVDLLVEKYIERTKRYFLNCLDSVSEMSAEDYRLFLKFTSKYGKPFRSTNKWENINVKRIEKDFRDELKDKVYDEFFHITEVIDLKNILVAEEIDIYEYDFYPKRASDSNSLLYHISRSYLYNTILHSRVPKKPQQRDILRVILLENRFHIFVDDSDHSGQFDASFTYQNKLNLPQVAIEDCGTQRLQHIKVNELKETFSTHCRSAA